MMPIDLILADDHALVRNGLRELLTCSDDFRVVGEAADGAALLSLLDRVPCDVVLLDLSMPGLAGVELIQELRRLHSSLPLLVLSMHTERTLVLRALRAGASGYVTKFSDFEPLTEAVRRVAGGGRYIESLLVDAVVFPGESRPESAEDLLSAREMQVLARIAAGQALGEIAEALQVSPKTVSTYKMRMMDKLGLQTNADLLKYAVRNGISED